MTGPPTPAPLPPEVAAFTVLLNRAALARDEELRLRWQRSLPFGDAMAGGDLGAVGVLDAGDTA